MKWVVTGGGTGGHVYPALEVARLARERGADLSYLGSLRGQEAEACRRASVPFLGLPSEPLLSLRTPAGWRGLIRLIRATGMAKAALRKNRPDVVFSTGGYGAAPVMAAARSLRIPYVIHEANSVPGRSNRMFAAQAAQVTCIFRATPGYLPRAKVERTGQPIRRELREAAADATGHREGVLVLGGSQGSLFLNERVPQAAERISEAIPFVHAVGRKLFDTMSAPTRPGYRWLPYLETPALLEAYRHCAVVVARSGSTVAEFAVFGLPSVLVPLPSSADDHQLHNAYEFVQMKAARLVPQSEATPEALAGALRAWLEDSDARREAEASLREWDIPGATERIVELTEAAA